MQKREDSGKCAGGAGYAGTKSQSSVVSYQIENSGDPSRPT